MESVGGMGGTASNVAMFVVVGIAIYYFYKWLSGDGEMNEEIIFNPAQDGMPAKSAEMPKPLVPTKVSLYQGGEFSLTTWIYIADWTVNKGKNKPFLVVSGGPSFATMVMYLGQNASKLGIRVSTAGDGSGSVSDSEFKLNTAKLNSIRPVNGGAAGGEYMDTNLEKCDIENIDLQRWVCITTVLNGRTLDVYIDGKMSRSCVLNGMFLVDSASGGSLSVTLGGLFGFGGLIGQTRVADFAYSPDRVYQNYQSGPNDTSILTKIKSYFDPKQYSFSLKVNGQDMASAST
jgi:hypothetical protein